MINKVLGHYRIVRKLGEGGMGEVYSALDTKLGREVALKLLPDAFARDPERLARFKQEARLLAALNHPNIAAIYGLEEAQDVGPGSTGPGLEEAQGVGPGRTEAGHTVSGRAGRVQFLVLELVPGETLAERVGRGAIPIEEALGLARQMCEALEAAHERGIIHRDLKPANVKVTPEGKVKVLDFGLAKAFAPEGEAMRAVSPSPGSPGRPSSPSHALSQSPTLTYGATREGVILGTAPYMSPEQARGKPLDKRTDIWSFGCVLYELLTGKQAFHGETISDTIANILNREPDWLALPAGSPAGAPAGVRRLLRRCLEKKAERRLRDIGDIRIEIEDALAAPARIDDDLLPEAAGPNAVRGSGRRGTLLRHLPWGIAALGILLASVAILGPWRPGAQPEREPRRLTITLPREAPLALQQYSPEVVLSPDGSRLVYVARAGGTTQLYLRPLDSYEVSTIRGTEGASGPFFSPDGEWVGFFAGGKLKKVALAGGAPVALCETTEGSASWGEDGTIVYSTWLLGGLMRVAQEGGVPETLTTLGEGESTHRWPEILPGSEAILFTSVRDWRWSFQGMNVCLLVLKTREVRTLVEGATHARYLPPGHLVYAVGGDLHARPFDLQSLRVKGETVVGVQDVRMNNPYAGGLQFSISSDGSLLHIPGGVSSVAGRLQWVSRSGKEEWSPLDSEPLSYGTVVLSPDGRRLAVEVVSEDGRDIRVRDVERETETRLTFDRSSSHPLWTPDGARITFRNARGGISWKAADGSGPEQELMSPEGFVWIYPSSWSPDGATLTFGEYAAGGMWDLWLFRPQGGRKPEPFLQTPRSEVGAVFSPDGRWLAYMSNESGRHEVYVVSFPDRAGKWQVSTGGGGFPVWARSGHELFYRHENRLMVVPVSTTPRFSVGSARLLFEAPYLDLDGFNYDASPDGRRFIVVKPVEAQAAAPSQIQIVLHWAEELKRRTKTAAGDN